MIGKQIFDTAANFVTNNWVLYQGTIGYETDTGRFKFGDNVTAWNSLAYATGSGSPEATSFGTIATTGNTDQYVIAPITGHLLIAAFSPGTALATSDTNYITFGITNLAQDGTGTNTMLAATNANTTKATGGSALVADAKRTLGLNGTATNLAVTAGDRIRVRYAVTGTLGGAIANAGALLTFGL